MSKLSLRGRENYEGHESSIFLFSHSRSEHTESQIQVKSSQNLQNGPASDPVGNVTWYHAVGPLTFRVYVSHNTRYM